MISTSSLQRLHDRLCASVTFLLLARLRLNIQILVISINFGFLALDSAVKKVGQALSQQQLEDAPSR